MFSPAPSLNSLTEAQRREAIASLAGYPPYRYLLELVQEVVEACLVSLAKSKTEPELLKAARLYQVAFSFFSCLVEHPEKLREYVEEELALKQDPFDLTTLNPDRMRLLQEMDQAQQTPQRKKK